MIADDIEETTTSIAGTSGDGAVTLTQLTSPTLPRFSSAFGSTGRRVRYEIEDITSGGGKFERGTGTLTSNVLTRDNVKVTWDGTNYLTNNGSGANPAALQFGSTPTAGNIRIRVAPDSDFAMPSTPFVQSAYGDDVGLMSPHHIIGVNAAASYVVDHEYYVPHCWTGAGEIVQVSFFCTAGSASTNIKLGIFEVGKDGLPGLALVRFDAMSLATGSVLVKNTNTGSWTPAGPIKLPPGWYYVGWIVNSATPTIRCVGNGTSVSINNTPLGVNNVATSYFSTHCLEKTTSSNSYSTGLPSDASAAGSYSLRSGSGKQSPLIYFKPRN